MRFYIYTSGCKINQYESQSLREAWLKKGWTEVEQSIDAEVILINSCAVTHRAVQDVRKMTRRFYRQNSQSKIIITGCAARIFSEDLGSLPGVRALVPQENKDKLKQLPLEEHGSDYWTSGENEQLRYPDFNISDYPRARPVIKTQDGCSRFCSYCIVPYTRGPARSRSPEDIRQEIDGLIERGFQEVVLSGINLAQYRTNGNGSFDFWDLVIWLEEKLVKKYQDKIRIRLSSLDPVQLNQKALEILRDSQLVCPHLHISIQSASDKILARMGRGHYSAKDIDDFLNQLSKIWPIYGLGADFLVGFPGETDQDFEKSLSFLREHPFSYAHIFTYSARPGTKAASLDGRVSAKEKKLRSSILRKEAQEKRLRFMDNLIQDRLKVEVVLEQEQPYLGICEYYIVCNFSNQIESWKKRDRVRAVIVSRQGNDLLAEPV